jgi:hypothetical protein
MGLRSMYTAAPSAEIMVINKDGGSQQPLHHKTITDTTSFNLYFFPQSKLKNPNNCKKKLFSLLSKPKAQMFRFGICVGTFSNSCDPSSEYSFYIFSLLKTRYILTLSMTDFFFK